MGFNLFIILMVTFQIKACGVAQLNPEVTARITCTMKKIMSSNL